MGDRAGIGERRLDSAGLHGESAVGRQPMRPILELRTERLADEQRAKAGAVDKQVAFDRGARFENEGFDVTALTILPHFRDLAFDAPHALLFGKAAQVAPVESRIEVIGIVERHILRWPEPPRRSRFMLEAIGADLTRDAELARAEPEMMEIDHPGRAPHRPERVDVAVALARPVLEGNAELECRPRGADEILFADPHKLVEGARGRDGGFANADGPDLVGFDQRDLDEVADLRRERISGDPTR